jgi:uncharacterized membrane protein
MGWSRLVPLVLLAAGVGLLVDAVARGGASVAVVVVVPVVFGASTEFLVGVVLLFFGLVSLPLALGYVFESSVTEELRSSARTEVPPAEVGGLILLGPLPVFFGRWGPGSRRLRVAAAAVGGALLVVFLVWLYLVLR